mgnify:FL=1
MASELMVITKAKELCSYVMVATEKSPKMYRFTFTSRLQNLSLEIVESVFRANDIFLGSDNGERLEMQRKAMADIRLLGYFSMLAMDRGCILSKQFEMISRLSSDCLNLLIAWMKGDRKRLGKG